MNLKKGTQGLQGNIRVLQRVWREEDPREMIWRRMSSIRGRD
jgi:hypothetical protein